MGYRCPICGKMYNTVAEVATCTQECAKREERREVLRREREKSAVNLENKIKEAYTQLKGMVNEYNEMNVGKKYTSELRCSTNRLDEDLRSRLCSINAGDYEKSPFTYTYTTCDTNAGTTILDSFAKILESAIKNEEKNCTCGGTCNGKCKAGKDKGDLEDYLTSILGI